MSLRPGRAPSTPQQQKRTLNRTWEPSSLPTAEEKPAPTRLPGIPGLGPGRPPLRPAEVLALQRTVGNAAVIRMLAAERRAGLTLGTPAGLVQRTKPLETNQMYKPKGSKKFKERPQEFGSVRIEFEDVESVMYKMVTRPVCVSGLVYPTETGERPSAPEPSTGIHVSQAKSGQPKVGAQGQNARNKGIVDAQKGHVMALELGGPDIPENIVPQWAQWQSNGEWRQMESQVAKIAREVIKKGNRLHYQAEIQYKSYGDGWIKYAPLTSITFPTGFTVTITELYRNTDIPVNSGSKNVIFDKEQAQNQTDEMMFMRTLQALSEGGGEEFEYSDWNLRAKKVKAKKGQGGWKGAFIEKAENPYQQHIEDTKEQRRSKNKRWLEFSEGWRHGYADLTQQFNTALYLQGYARGRTDYLDDYNHGFKMGYIEERKSNGETGGYYSGYTDGFACRQKNGLDPERLKQFQDEIWDIDDGEYNPEEDDNSAIEDEDDITEKIEEAESTKMIAEEDEPTQKIEEEEDVGTTKKIECE